MLAQQHILLARAFTLKGWDVFNLRRTRQGHHLLCITCNKDFSASTWELSFCRRRNSLPLLFSVTQFAASAIYIRLRRPPLRNT